MQYKKQGQEKAVQIQNYMKSRKTNSPTGDSAAKSLPTIGDSFMYVETSGNNCGLNVFVSFGRTGIIQISNVTCYYNRFSAGNDKAMRRFLSPKNQWHSKHIVAETPFTM